MSRSLRRINPWAKSNTVAHSQYGPLGRQTWSQVAGRTRGLRKGQAGRHQCPYLSQCTKVRHTPKEPQSHLITPSSTQPNHHRRSNTLLSCFNMVAYSLSISKRSACSPLMNAISSENSINRECVCRSDPANLADRAV